MLVGKAMMAHPCSMQGLARLSRINGLHVALLLALPQSLHVYALLVGCARVHVLAMTIVVQAGAVPFSYMCACCSLASLSAACHYVAP